MLKTIKTTDALLALRGDDGGIDVDGDVEIVCAVPWGVGQQIAYLNVGGDLSAWGDLNVEGDLYWAQMHMPRVRGSITCGRVLPHAHQREYWRERLAPWGIDMSGCYDEIIPRVQERLDEILASEQWTPTERWMLESLRDRSEPSDHKAAVPNTRKG